MLLFRKMLLAKAEMTIRAAPQRLFMAFMTTPCCRQRACIAFHFARIVHGNKNPLLVEIMADLKRLCVLDPSLKGGAALTLCFREKYP